MRFWKLVSEAELKIFNMFGKGVGAILLAIIVLFMIAAGWQMNGFLAMFGEDSLGAQTYPLESDLAGAVLKTK